MKQWVCMWLLVGCAQNQDRDEGTVVGNPGDGSLRVADVANGAIIGARTGVSTVEMESCTGERSVLSIDEEIDLLDDTSFVLPNGQWCGLQLFLEDGLYVEAVSDDRELYVEFNLDIEEILLEGEDGFQIDAGSFVVELAHPGWISLDLETVLDERDWDPEERDEIMEIEIGPEDAEHDDLVAIFADGSGLFQDTDRDGEITSQERETGWLAGGTAHPKRTTDDADSEAATEPVDGADALGSTAPLETSSGCGGQKGGMSWVFVGPFVLMGLRRQSPRH